MYKLLLILASIFTQCISLKHAHINPRSTKSEDTLQLVHVIFRHGDRTPEKEVLYPKDPLANVTYYPIGFGQLTNNGKRKLYMLGKTLHKRYGSFLGTYNIDTIDAFSSDYNRTKMSLQLVLASLFPPENELVWEKKLKWQPVPFNYLPRANDHVLGDPYKNCPRYKKLYDNLFESDKGSKMYQNYTHLYKYLRQHAGIEPNSKEMAEMYFTLTTEFENGLKLPEWTDLIYPRTLNDLAILEYELSTGTSELKRLSSGFLFNKIVSDTVLKMKNKLQPNRKMFLYSGHEITLAYLMKFLGTFYPHVPPYGACMLIEIHKIQGVWGVKIFYQDYSTKKLNKVKLPKCGHFCRFDNFVNLYKDQIPKSEKECLV